MKQKYLIIILLVATILLSGCSQKLSNQTDQSVGTVKGVSESDKIYADDKINQSQSTNKNTSMPEMTIDQNKTYTAILHTEAGDIEISLNAKTTPITVNSFVSLAKKNFYNGTIFHRAINGFMIQGGDPTGTGSGGPGYKFNDEPFTGEYTRGTLAMANAGPNTNGSQFFIMHADNPLPKNYVIFGQVTKGLEVVDKIATAPVQRNEMGELSQPITPIKILTVDIVEK